MSFMRDESQSLRRSARSGVFGLFPSPAPYSCWGMALTTIRQGRAFLEQYRSLQVPGDTRVNQKEARSSEAQKQLNRIRLLVEMVNSQLQEQMHLSKHYAKSIWGLMTRIAAKLTAHSAGMMVNLLLGRPLLHLASLASDAPFARHSGKH